MDMVDILILFNLDTGESWIWLAFLHFVVILPPQRRQQVQSGADLTFWLDAFLAVYFSGLVAGDPNVGCWIYCCFCLDSVINSIRVWMLVKNTVDLTLEAD